MSCYCMHVHTRRSSCCNSGVESRVVDNPRLSCLDMLTILACLEMRTIVVLRCGWLLLVLSTILLYNQCTCSHNNNVNDLYHTAHFRTKLMTGHDGYLNLNMHVDTIASIKTKGLLMVILTTYQWVYNWKLWVYNYD